MFNILAILVFVLVPGLGFSGTGGNTGRYDGKRDQQGPGPNPGAVVIMLVW